MKAKPINSLNRYVIKFTRDDTLRTQEVVIVSANTAADAILIAQVLWDGLTSMRASVTAVYAISQRQYQFLMTKTCENRLIFPGDMNKYLSQYAEEQNAYIRFFV